MKGLWLSLLIACAGCAAADTQDAPPRQGEDALPEQPGEKTPATLTNANPALPLQAESGGSEPTIIPHPSWTCDMPNGIPPPRLGKPAFTAEFDVKANNDLGATQYGQRRLLQFGAGRFSGSQLDATLTSGGYEQVLTLPNGAVELEQVLVLRGGRGGYIYLRVCGTAADATSPVRVVMDFEAPNSGPYAGVNRAKLVGTRSLSADGRKLTLEVFDVTSVAPTADRVTVENPSNLPNQTWECKKLTGTKGGEVYRETVGIGGSQSVGASKRGTRNIIPITGGTSTGRLPGTILPLGADFQLLGAQFIIDARYVIKTSDGTLVIVRNCGALGALVPVFEAPSASRYAFLNEDKWLSSNPSIGLGSVSLTIFEKR